MMEHRKYGKTPRYGEGNTHQLMTSDEVEVTVKLDGTNIQIWLDDGDLRVGSRNYDITDEPAKAWRGFDEWLTPSRRDELVSWMTDNRVERIYGEWLVHHTVKYPEEWYLDYYAFQFDRADGSRIPVTDVVSLYGYPYSIVPIVEVNKPRTLEGYQDLLMRYDIIPKFHEGLVVRYYGEFDDYRQVTKAKVIRPKFNEDKGQTLKPKTSAVGQWEPFFADQYVTPTRVVKAKSRAMESKGVSEWSSQLIGATMGYAFDDILYEEGVTMMKKSMKRKSPLDVGLLKREIDKRVKAELGL